MTPFSSVYETEVVLSIELEVKSLKVVLETVIPENENEWVQKWYDKLALLDEKRLQTLHHM